IEVRIAGDAMLIRPHAATNGSIVGVGDGRHRSPAAAEKPLAAPCGERRHVTLLHVFKAESIEHDYNRTLLRPLSEGGTGEKRGARSKKLPARKQGSSHSLLLLLASGPPSSSMRYAAARPPHCWPVPPCQRDGIHTILP